MNSSHDAAGGTAGADTVELDIPELSLVVLIGVSGAGKSTFARQHFQPTEVISADRCRALVSDDENDQGATADAFDVLTVIAGKRLARGKLTVIDATSVQPRARRALVALAREHDVLPVAIVLDVPEQTCLARDAARAGRSVGAAVIARQYGELHQGPHSLGYSLDKEGFRRVHVLRGPQRITAVTITRTRMSNDLRHESGPFDVIGDVHGCRAELEALLGKLGYAITRDAAGRASGARYPGSGNGQGNGPGRRAVFLGDLVDRGPDSPGVLRLVMGMVAAGDAFCVPGNHESKFARAMRRRSGQPAAQPAMPSAARPTGGLAESLAQFEAEPAAFGEAAVRFVEGLTSHYVLDGGRLVVAHAGLPERYQGRSSGRVRALCLYGQSTGQTDEYGLPVRHPWAREYRGSAMVLYGHTPALAPRWVNNTMCLDTGCVFGGELTALRYPEKELVAVPAARAYYEPAKPLAAQDT